MQYRIFQADAFADKLFAGNPAAVVPLEQWPDDQLMQSIAMENNLAETAFFVPLDKNEKEDFHLRWFTPELEIDLCGHATLASAFILYNYLGWESDTIIFRSKSGALTVTRKGELIELDFPAWMPSRVNEDSQHLSKALGGVEIIGVYKKRDIVVELNSDADVRNCRPDFSLLRQVEAMVMITAPGKDCDYVCRFFAPAAGIDEDPVTGSAHAQLIPFWAEKLGKKKLLAKQVSKRGGTIHCEHHGDRVKMSGHCVFYMEGKISVDR